MARAASGCCTSCVSTCSAASRTAVASAGETSLVNVAEVTLDDEEEVVTAGAGDDSTVVESERHDNDANGTANRLLDGSVGVVTAGNATRSATGTRTGLFEPLGTTNATGELGTCRTTIARSISRALQQT